MIMEATPLLLLVVASRTPIPPIRMITYPVTPVPVNTVILPPLKTRRQTKPPLFLAFILFRQDPHHFNPTKIPMRSLLTPHPPLLPSGPPPRLNIFLWAYCGASLCVLCIDYMFSLPYIRYEDVKLTRIDHSSFSSFLPCFLPLPIAPL